MALIVALLYQIALRRFGWRLLVYWVLTFGGLLAAELLAESAGWNFTRLGDLRLGPDLIGMLCGIGVLRILRL
jgi:hypothetical protein